MQFENVLPPGTQARVISEWIDVNVGEIINIIKYNPTQGYLVRTNSKQEEFWVPVHVLTNNNRKPWTFRFRKPVIQERRSVDMSSYVERSSELTYPKFVFKLTDANIVCGSKVLFKCKVKPFDKNLRISWQKIKPDQLVIRNSGRFIVSQDEDGTCSLLISNARITDSGIYTCCASNVLGSVQCSAVLNVSDSLSNLQEPKVQIISSTSVLLEWENNGNTQFYVEYCRLGTGEWLSPNNSTVLNSDSYTIKNLDPGETYSFRLVTTQNNVATLPTMAITLPVADDLRWQQDQFNRRYLEMEEIGRGRFSVVKKAKDRGTGFEVALKQVFRRKQTHKVTQAEYTLLAGIQHKNVIRALALFNNAPVPGIDTIVLEM